MSRRTHRDLAGGRTPAEHRLARFLESPLLARVVPHLAPETLHQLIRFRGLDACGELVAAATPAQITSLLDLDLWRPPQAGRDERFDADRFGEWLEALVDTSHSVAARIVAALDERVAVLGLSRYVRVFDPGTFEPTESSDDEPMDRHEMMNSESSGDAAECEVGGYLLRARRPEAWDAIVTLLGTLEAEYESCFHLLMQGCRRLSNSRPETDGLDDLLMAPEQHLHDVAIEREGRRSRRGYSTSADARAFLQMARRPPAASAPTAPGAINPIAAAYFRASDERVDTTQKGTPARAPERASDSSATVAPAPEDDDLPASIEGVIALLAEAGVTPAPPLALLEAPGEEGAERLPLLKRLMAFVLRHDDTAYLARSRELAFLANALLAGASVQSRPFTPREASEAAACICNLGLECWLARAPGTTSRRERDGATLPDAFLADHDLVTVFEAGWSVLYHDVSLFVADRLASTLADLHCTDAGTRLDVRVLERRLVEQREAGTPWRARDSADVLARLDVTAWIGVLGLLDECPILPAALTAVLERRATPVSATAFEFIATRAQIGDVRLFMRALPDVLSG